MLAHAASARPLTGFLAAQHADHAALAFSKHCLEALPRRRPLASSYYITDTRPFTDALADALRPRSAPAALARTQQQELLRD